MVTPISVKLRAERKSLGKAERKTKRCSCEMIQVFFISSSQDRSITMTSIARLSGILRRLFCVEANRLARQAGVIQRERVLSGASLLQLLVFGWLTNPHGGPSHLARFAGSLGLKLR